MKNYWKNLPKRQFWLANILFWLVLTCLATDNSYRQLLAYERPANWIEIWFNYLPWWMLWAVVAPFVIAACKSISYREGKSAQFIGKNLLSALLFLGIYWLLTIVLSWLIEYHGSLDYVEKVFRQWRLSLLHIDVLVYLAIVCLGYTFSYYQQSRAQQLRSESLAKQLVQVELQSLKSQINPHFLFNTLNTVASLIRLDKKDDAVKALSELSLMLRKVLENQGNQMITLEQEMEFINSYLSIQKMRFEHKLETQVEFSQNCLHNEIPFMLLQPLVENAVQHGSQLETNKNLLSLKVYCEPGILHVHLINKVPEKDEHKGFGIGLKNCRERLDKLYPDNYKLELKALEDGYFETSLSIPLGATDD